MTETTFNIIPVQVAGRDIGRVTRAEMQALSDFIMALPGNAPEFTEGKTFELDGRTWRLSVEVSEGDE